MKYYKAAALGRVLGLGEDEIKAMTRRGTIREGYAGGDLYILEVSAREIIAGLKKPEERRRTADYTSERAQLMRLRRQRAEYDLALREKDLHLTEDIEQAILRTLTGFKAKIRAIPSRMAAQCAKLTSKEDIFDLLKQVTDEALTELADLNNIFDAADEAATEEENRDAAQ